MHLHRIAVACRNASGKAVLIVLTVPATKRDIVLGRHYDRAELAAADQGYEGPYVCFDEIEQDTILNAAQQLELVPQVVVVDITDGLVHSVRCDAGEIKVICYDEGDAEESSEAVADHPVGEGGALVHSWAHIEIATTDPGLRVAR